MNILMIGNGFDLEHGLPTKYTDFLKFLKDFNKAYHSPTNPSLMNKFEEIYFSDSLKERYSLSDNKPIINALHRFTCENLWINYFIRIHDEHLCQKENWIDFESEISSVVQTMDRLMKYYENCKFTGVKDTENIAIYNFCMETLSKFISKDLLEVDKIKSCIRPMLFDLNRLICALELYIIFYINCKEISYYSPDILNHFFDKVISFNYSMTYDRLYDSEYKNADFHYVHGSVRSILMVSWYELKELEKDPDWLEGYMTPNDMILGIDEYLSDDRRSKEVDFLPFKKYYQRVYKQTTNKYKEWLREMNAKEGSERQNTLFIFGHSLDVTDGDVLRDFMNHNGIKTVIYYKDKKQFGQQITNLVKVLGSDAFIEKVYGSDPSIFFQHQSIRREILGNEFKLHLDIRKLKKIHEVSQREAEKLLSKINHNIEQKNLEYFCSQSMVITLYDVLQKKGLGVKYFDKLLKIACEIYAYSKYDYHEWAYWHYDNTYRCDKSTMEFIDYINKYNDNIIMSEGSPISEFIQNELIANPQISTDKTSYLKLVNDVFKKFGDGDDKIYWGYLVKVSCGSAAKIAKEAIQELLEKLDNAYDLIRYAHLLDRIHEYEYMNENM